MAGIVALEDQRVLVEISTGMFFDCLLPCEVRRFELASLACYRQTSASQRLGNTDLARRSSLMQLLDARLMCQRTFAYTEQSGLRAIWRVQDVFDVPVIGVALLNRLATKLDHWNRVRTAVLASSAF